MEPGGDVIVNIDLDSVITRLDTLIELVNKAIVHLYTIQVYIRVIIWIIGVVISFYIAIWFFKRFVMRYVRQFIKFKI